jgi:GT2 family glycosyltransferase/glycosyltransferase involved in cell wall biosynthesis
MNPIYGIDIIIPIYNAFEDLILCIESIKRYTDLNNNRLILINDKSPDTRILPYLKSIQSENIIIIDNEENLGFSASVNKGIQYSERDVVLLNTDTIVTKKWLDKIVACAYKEKEIATVTPLSNSATLCSIPNFCEDNEIPNNVTIDEYAELVERCSLKRYPKITVAVGFCMFIKREVISCVGLFDSKTFGKGYGEENDFCFRAEQYGYKHVMCDDTFIYHKGTVSFKTEEKLKLIKKHEGILEDRYGLQMRKNREYCRDNPDQIIRDNINLYMKFKNGKKNILYLIHSDFHKDANDNVGGTQLHLKDLVLELKSIYNVFVMSRDENYFRVTAYVGDDNYSFKFNIGEKNIFPIFREERHAYIYQTILNAFAINLVHVHHSFGLSLDLYYEANRLNIPIVLTLHDYYYICPTIKLLNKENKVCIGCETEKMCKDCLHYNYHIAENIDFLPYWRQECEKALKLCDKIITPSDVARNIVLKYYPDLHDKIQVIEHGSDNLYLEHETNLKNVIITDDCKVYIEKMFSDNQNFISGWAYIQDADSKKSRILLEIKDEHGNCEIFSTQKLHRADVAGDKLVHMYSGFHGAACKEYFENGRLFIRVIVECEEYYTDGKIYEYNLNQIKREKGLNVAFIGGINIPKGSEMINKLVKNNTNKEIKWYIFGGIADEQLLKLNKEDLVKTGWYSRDYLPRMIEKFKIDLICILPIWHETFCYTVSEAVLCGVPIIATDMGAVGQRIIKMDCGWCFALNSSCHEYLDLLNSILKNKEEYNKKLHNIKSLKLRSVHEMNLDYIELYDKIIGNEEKYTEYDSKFIYENYINYRYKYDDNVSYLDIQSDIVRKLDLAVEELNMIRNSTTYKLSIKMREVKIPFKKQFKKLFHNAIINSPHD